MTDSQQIYHMVPARTSFHFSNRRTGIHIVLHTRLLRGTWERVERREKKKELRSRYILCSRGGDHAAMSVCAVCLMAHLISAVKSVLEFQIFFFTPDVIPVQK